MLSSQRVPKSMPSKGGLIHIFFAIFIPYLLSSLLFYFGLSISLSAIIAFSSLLLVSGVFLFIRARRTIRREKEIVFSNIASVFVFSSIFGVLNFLGVIEFSLLISLGLIVFFVFLFIRDLEFIQKISDVNFLFLTVVRMLKAVNFGKFTDPIILVAGVVLSLTFYQTSLSREYEKNVLYEIAFSYMVIIVIETILKMSFGI